MKKIMFVAAVALVAMPLAAQEKLEVPDDSLVFTTVLENPVTSIKNQNNSGTCWSYSSLAFLESEAIRKNPSLKEDLDLCESFLVSKTYTDRADRNVRTHGDASFSQGGSFYDAIFCMENYGLIPEGIMPYPITLYGDSLYNFTNFFPPMEAYIGAIAKSDARKINPVWKKDVQNPFFYLFHRYTLQEFQDIPLSINQGKRPVHTLWMYRDNLSPLQPIQRRQKH